MTERFDPEYTDRLFREGLEGYSEIPHSHVWQSLRQQVPVRRRFMAWQWAAAAAVLISFGAGMFTQSYLIQHHSAIAQVAAPANATPQQNTPVASTIATPENNTQTNAPAQRPITSTANTLAHNTSTANVPSYTHITNNTSNSAIEPSVANTSTTQVESNKVTPIQQETNNESLVAATGVVIDDIPVTSSIQNIPQAEYAFISPASTLPSSIDTRPVPDIALLRPAFRPHFYIGANGAFNNVNLIDKKNLHDTYQFQFMQTTGSSYGVQAGLAFAKHWDVELRYTAHSWQGQRYLYRVNEKYMPEREIRLDYYYYPLLFKYHTRLTRNADFATLFGGEYGKYRINDAYEYNTATSQIDQFRRSDFEAMAGLGIDVSLCSHIKLGLYGMASCGSNLGAASLLPISTTPNSPPPTQANRATSNDFQNPHNLLYGLNMALNVQL